MYKHLTPPTLVEPKNDKNFERLQTTENTATNVLPTASSQHKRASLRIHLGPPRPRAGSPRALLFSLCFPLFMQVSGVFGL